MQVVAVVVAWRQVDQLPACLAALDAQTHPDLEVVVVDNASGDGSIEVVEAAIAGGASHPLRLVRNATNRGFAGGVHDGLAHAHPGAEALWLVNVDCIPAPEHLEHLVAALEDDPGCAAAQGQLVRPPSGEVPLVDSTGIEANRARLFRDRDEGRPVREVRRPPGEVFGVTGACGLFRLAALEEVAWRQLDGRRQPLTEDVFAFFEDVELAWRLQRFGWRCRYVPAATAEHERGGIGPRRTAFVEELNWANRLLVVATCDDRAALRRASLLVTLTTLLKTAELLVSVPGAALPALRRWWVGRPGAAWRRRQLDARAPVPAGMVVARWFRPFSWRQWVTTWWRRIRARSAEVAERG